MPKPKIKKTDPTVLAQAAADHAADVEVLADLDEGQIDYLFRVNEIEDETTGLECGGV